jgi:heme-degrading monooxygenase HmoA
MNTESVVLINLFEVPTDADKAFIAAWEGARDFLITQDGYLETALHQSLRPDAEFRFVNVARWASPQAFQKATSQPEFPGRDMPFPAHPALYGVVREDVPTREEPNAVVRINAFEVPADADEAFIGGWERARDFPRERPGYVGTRLHQSVSPDADFRFVNIGLYESPQAFQAAIQHPDFPGSRMPFPAHPSLYEVVRR